MKLISNAVVYALSANHDLAVSVCKCLGTTLGDVHLAKFPSGEIMASPIETVRGKQVFIIQSTCPPVNDNIMETLIFIDAVRRASAREITVIIPYFGYARQDRKSKAREPISSKLVADLLTTAGADRVMTFDLHAAQIQGFFSCLEDDLSAIPLLGHVLYNDKDVNKEKLVVVSPDHGGVNRARKIAEKLNTPIAIIDKRRNSQYQPEVMNIIGDVNGKDCMIVDDMIDSAGSAVAASNALRNAGAQKIMMVCTHPVFSDPAYERLTTSKAFSKLYVTDSIPLPKRFAENKELNIHVCSLAPVIAEAILAISNETPVSDVYEMYKD
ncbi:MAG: ribose-phosphate pyrophosphokinase [Bacilli bacterium]